MHVSVVGVEGKINETSAFGAFFETPKKTESECKTELGKERERTKMKKAQRENRRKGASTKTQATTQKNDY